MAGMTPIEEKTEWVQATVKLIELTQKGQLIWESVATSQVPLLGKLDERILAAFSAEYLSQRLLLTKRSFSSEVTLAPGLRSFGRVPNSSLLLQLLNSQGTVIYTVPQIEALGNLFEEISLQSTNVRGFLDQLLKSEAA